MSIETQLHGIENKSVPPSLKPYHSPTLEVLGSVNDLVMGSGSGTNEGSPGGMPMAM